VSNLPATEIPRGRFEGVANVVRFNWPLYVAGASAVAVGVVLTKLPWLPRWAAAIVLAGVCVAVYLLVASLVVSHWVYDRSSVYRLDWARRLVGESPRSLVNLHSGFDESSERLARIFPGAKLDVLDFYDPVRMTEPSIARARRQQAGEASVWLSTTTQRITVTNLPLPEGTVDAAFLIFAAHEVRDANDRQKLFDQLRRSLKPGGRLILLEHLRDAANFAVFGPQFVHFLSRRTWLEHAARSGLIAVETFTITPFVRCFVFERPS